jgi:hypothetical protein
MIIWSWIYIRWTYSFNLKTGCDKSSTQKKYYICKTLVPRKEKKWRWKFSDCMASTVKHWFLEMWASFSKLNSLFCCSECILSVTLLAETITVLLRFHLKGSQIAEFPFEFQILLLLPNIMFYAEFLHSALLSGSCCIEPIFLSFH